MGGGYTDLICVTERHEAILSHKDYPAVRQVNEGTNLFLWKGVQWSIARPFAYATHHSFIQEGIRDA